ncbi:MAG: SurA N-terminal domain-containing protein, partial [Deltaproteobacteria bacterium]|nr:SurA N-terminal domain-containing protein [Deltaproteobacteria bacterium]
MLEYIRNNVAGIFGFAIIAILAFVFTVSFGPQDQGWGKTSDNSTIITVDGNKINSATLNYATSINTDRDIKADSPEYAALRQQVAEGLVERSLLISLAKKMNITASKDEAMESIIKGEYYITRPIEALNSQIGFQMMYGGVDSSIIANILIGEGHKANLGRFVDKDGKFDSNAFNKTIRYRLNFKEDAFIEEQRIELIAK